MVGGGVLLGVAVASWVVVRVGGAWGGSGVAEGMTSELGDKVTVGASGVNEGCPAELGGAGLELAVLVGNIGVRVGAGVGEERPQAKLTRHKLITPIIIARFIFNLVRFPTTLCLALVNLFGSQVV